MSGVKKMKNNVKKLALMGACAGIYVVMTVCMAPLSYGGVQFRVAEALMLLCFYRKEYVYALTVGCLISNMFSPLPLDMLFGTLATLIAAVPMYFIGKKADTLRLLKMIIASLFPVISNGIIIGLELNVVFGEPFLISFCQVAFGELVCVTVLGVTIFKSFEKNRMFVKMISFGEKNHNS